MSLSKKYKHLLVVVGQIIDRAIFVSPVLLAPYFLDVDNFNEFFLIYTAHLLFTNIFPCSLMDIYYSKEYEDDQDRVDNVFFIYSVVIGLLVIMLALTMSYYLYAMVVVWALYRSKYQSVQLTSILYKNLKRYQRILSLNVLFLIGFTVSLYLFRENIEYIIYCIAFLSLLGLVFILPKTYRVTFQAVGSLKGSSISITYIRILIGWLTGYGLSFIFNAFIEGEGLLVTNSMIAIFGIFVMFFSAFVNQFYKRFLSFKMIYLILLVGGLAFLVGLLADHAVFFQRIHPYIKVYADHNLAITVLIVSGVFVAARQIKLLADSKFKSNLLRFCIANCLALSLLIGLLIYSELDNTWILSLSYLVKVPAYLI